MAELPDRIESKIRQNPVTGCWEWTACITSTGYGRIWDGRRADWAHRVVYVAIRGRIPTGLVLDHLCRVRHCVNPDHLEPVTDAENTSRGDCPDVTRERHRAKRWCKRGHPLFGNNLYRNPNGRRVCRTCRRIHKATYSAKRVRADVLLEIANTKEGAETRG